MRWGVVGSEQGLRHVWWAKLIRAGYTKSDVKSGRANSWMLPSDVIVAAAATVVPSTVRDR